MSLTAKLHPDRFTAMSPKMTAIIAYVLGDDWTDPQIGWMSVSSDGYATTDSEGLCMNSRVQDDPFVPWNLSRFARSQRSWPTSSS